ncbi:MAG: CoB--CoM heterodisulfide reductase iron-sulfur subunit A family protein [Candidatus Cloacimonadota bacterium]|nr:MAG: CoB--CoM heterodisulfide reductase iron-sulfur subunit A family protein [Candidatus Cloacimonadota bacterium]
MEKRVVVIGGGIAGLTAALTAAELGKKVLLVEKSPSIGGMLERLDTWFVDDACGMCQILPQLASDEKLDRCLRRDFYHPFVEVKTLTEIKSVENTEEGIKVTLRRLPRYVDEIKCTSCRLCEEVCPEEDPDQFNRAFTKHKAIHTMYTGSLTKTYYIDKKICTECGKCIEVCPTSAINLNQKEEEEEEIIASALIVSAGFSEIDPTALSSFGYGKYKNVLTSLDFERMISRTGVHPDEIKKPSDGKKPGKIAIIQCVGSRDKDREYCSSACCMYAVKEARKIKEISKDIAVSVFYMDLRAFGKGHYRYVQDTEKRGVEFKNFRIPSVTEDTDGNLIVTYEEETIKNETYDLVILSTGQQIKEDAKKMLEIIGIKTDEYGFAEGKRFETFKTEKENIYIAGSVCEPKDIEGSVIEARAVGFLAADRESEEKDSFETLDIDYRIPKFGIFICQCGGVTQKDLNTGTIKKALEGEHDVAIVEEIDLLCQEKRLDTIMEKVREKDITRIIFATCSPAKYEILIRKSAETCGFNQAMIDILRMREHIAWSYEHGGEDVAIQRSKALMEKLRLAEPDNETTGKGTSTAVIIGGGVAGMAAAHNLSNKGVKVHLVEKNDSLGGNANNLTKTLEGDDVIMYLESIIKDVTEDPNITLHFESELSSLSGTAGAFVVQIQKGEEKTNIAAGAIIVATGADEYVPTEYQYGKDNRIVTQIQFEKALKNSGNVPKSVVMIQCVGSRSDEHQWCSKVCCSDAIKNALELKEKNKDIEVTILYRDMMSYGKKELFFKKAREKGINFIRFKKDDEPQVSISNGLIEVTVNDLLLNRKLKFEPETLVLSTGIVPHDNKKLSEVLGVTLDEDGYFEGANPKFRPVESKKTGIFFAGLCRAPSAIKDAVAEATASAGNAFLFLREKVLIQRRSISEVIERWCAGCEFCVEACPFDARYLDEEKKVVKVRILSCTGCGNCVSICPSGASKLKGFKDRQVIGMIDVSI